MLDEVDGQERHGHLPGGVVEAARQHQRQEHGVARKPLHLRHRLGLLDRDLVALEHARGVEPHQARSRKGHQELALQHPLPREAGQQDAHGQRRHRVPQGRAHAVDGDGGGAAFREPVGQRGHRRGMEQRRAHREEAHREQRPSVTRQGPEHPVAEPHEDQRRGHDERAPVDPRVGQDPGGKVQRRLGRHAHGREAAHLHVVEAHAPLEGGQDHREELHEPVDDEVGQSDETQEPETLPAQPAHRGVEPSEDVHGRVFMAVLSARRGGNRRTGAPPSASSRSAPLAPCAPHGDRGGGEG